MKFGVNTFIWSDRFDRSSLPLLPKLKERGFDGVELPLLDPKETRDLEVRQALVRSGLECTFCSVFVPGHSFIDQDESVRRKTVAHMRECIRTVADMGSRLLVGPLYSPVRYLPGRRRNGEEWKRAVNCLQQLGPELASSNVKIAIEPLNRFESYFLNTVADTVSLCEAVGHAGVGVLLDTFHANIEEKHLGDACRSAGQHLLHVHASENDRGIPGSGHVQWGELFKALRQLNYDAWITIESFNFSGGELPKLLCIWRDLAHSSEAIAFEGVRFLRYAARDGEMD
jgi:D-psicose/D-tagatose/L-ribulose 3-epimerase